MMRPYSLRTTVPEMDPGVCQWLGGLIEMSDSRTTLSRLRSSNDRTLHSGSHVVNHSCTIRSM